jgi:Carboxypeptidase regulatory-like domain/TonB dependent receptor
VKRCRIQISCLLSLLLLGSGIALAQTVTSEISGTVTDGSANVVPGAEVTVTAIATGIARVDKTDPAGAYHVAGLAPGQYTLRVEGAGFKTLNRAGITLTVNEHPVINAALEIGAAQQQVTVNANASQLETTTAQLSGVVSGQALRELPLNGRDLQQLILLQTGAVASSNAGVNSFGLGTVNKVAVQGTRPMMNNLTIDGGDINDPSFNEPPGNLAGVQLGVEAMEEFRVVLNPYAPQYGRNAGANVQYVTRSGTNNLHGSAYGFLRNASLDAANYFDTLGKPYFARYQFGGTLGGAIVKDKTFFFMNYEGFREQRGLTVSTTVPDANAHLGLLPSAADPSMLEQVAINPAIQPFLNLYPLPNGEDLGSGFGILNVSRIQPTHENYGMVRIDHKLTNNDQVFGRYIIDNGYSLPPFQSTSIPGFPGMDEIADQFIALGEQHTFNANSLNDFRFAFDRTKYGSNTDNSYPLSVSFVPGRALGGISVSGLPLLGNNLVYPINSTTNVFEYIDNLSYEHGHHNLRFGADIKRMQMNGSFDLYTNGEYAFADLSAFGVPATTTNPAFENFLKGTPEIYLGTNPALADSERGFRQNYFGLYAQDDWKVLPNLTVNYGIRWEYQSNPGEAHGKIANIRNLATDATATIGKIWSGVPNDLWSPRVGLSYSANGSTVIRAGYGLIRDQIYENLYGDIRYYPPFFQSLQYILPLFQAPPQSIASIVGAGGAPKTIGSDGAVYNPKFPYYSEWSLGVQREFAQDYVLDVTYVGTKGTHLPNGGEANLLPGGKAINPNYGSLLIQNQQAISNYNALQASVKKRTSYGLTMQGSYTYSHSLDDASGPFPSDFVSESGYAQNYYDLRGDYGRSAFDRRHVFVVNSLYDLPFGHSRSFGDHINKVENLVLGDWSAGGILSLESGLPFEVNLGGFDNAGLGTTGPAQRPNVKPGANYCGSSLLGKPSEWFDPSIFTLQPTGEYGNATRNAMCGPALYNLDFSMIKEAKVGERATIEFRSEFFNILNHPNFSVPVNTEGPNGSGGNGDAVFSGRLANCDPSSSSTGCGALAPNVGRIFSTVTTSRQIQFGVKVIF